MLRLWIIRHAKSDWSEPVADHERDLNKRGRRDAPRMAEWLARQDRRPSRILSSDAIRTRRTSVHLAAACALDETAVDYRSDLYLASVPGLLAAIRELPDDCADVALVGHNPGVTDLANALLDRPRIDDLPTLGMAGIDLPAPWRAVAPGLGHLAVITSPKRL